MMQELTAQLTAALDESRPTAYCRLVETRGSTPQKAGATMLVFADGSQAGTLGGGCVEAEVKRRAIAALQTGKPEVSVFQLDSDYGWDDGLICGGRMQVLIQPLGGGAGGDAGGGSGGDEAVQYFRRLAALVSEGQGGTEAIVYADADQLQLPCPSSLLFDSQSQPRATLGIAAAPEAVLEQLRPLSESPRPYAAAGVAYLPWLPRCRLLIVGGGHVGQAVAALASDLEFDVWVVDDRQEYVTQERFPGAQKRIHGPIDDVLPALDVTPNTYCLIVTRGHAHDERALFHLVGRGARYVGMIGSRRKIRLIYEDLMDEGVSAEALQQVYAPLGINIGSQTVSEIAVSICAELVAHRNCNGAVPGRPAAVSLAAES